MSPNDLEFLLFYYWSPVDHENLSSRRELVDKYLADGVFEIDESRRGRTYKVSDKGVAWVEMILATPQPEFRWVDPRVK